MIGGPLRNLVQTAVMTVTIGGVNAPVQFAGAVPGAVAGLTQINVQVPAGLTPVPRLARGREDRRFQQYRRRDRGGEVVRSS